MPLLHCPRDPDDAVQMSKLLDKRCIVRGANHHSLYRDPDKIFLPVSIRGLASPRNKQELPTDTIGDLLVPIRKMFDAKFPKLLKICLASPKRQDRQGDYDQDRGYVGT